jgi:putative hydrolase of the HAD superfamily
VSRAPIRFVLFDYGNTLVPYGRREAAVLDGVLADAVARWISGVDAATFRGEVGRVKESLIRGALESGDEVGNGELALALARAAGAPGAPPGMAADLEARVAASFVEVLRLPPDVLPVLDALAPRYTLGLLSNWYLPAPLHRSLEIFGIRGRLAAAVVSGEIGRVKPHRSAFEALLGPLGADPGECAFVGDNLHADIEGAAALGMRTVHTREWLEDALGLDAHPGGASAAPDAVIDRLVDLPAALEALEAA